MSDDPQPLPNPQPLPEGHPVREAWVRRIVAGSTPDREFGPDGEFRGWINPDLRSSAEPLVTVPGLPAGAVATRGSADAPIGSLTAGE